MSRVDLYFVRHGETEWNKEGRLQGWLDSKLTLNGCTQAEMLREELQAEKFHAVYASPLQRATRTAEILVEQEIHFDDRLKEIHLGTWQGKLISDIWKEDYERYFAYCNKPEIYQPIGGETFRQVSDRMFHFLMDCQKNHKDERILVVSHGVAIRALLLKVMNLPIRNIWEFEEIDGTSVTKITIENENISVPYIGHIGHLALL